ncbi:MAG: zinc ribbon domain-containing protein [Actinomycetales bacterium]
MTTAPPAAQVALLDLAEIDTHARQLAHRARSLPEHAELTELSTRSARLAEDRARIGTAVADLERAVRKAEADVELVRTRAARDTERLNAGVGSAKDLQGLQHEIDGLARRQSELEDAELEVMEELETAQRELDEVQARQQDTEQAVLDATARRDQSQAEIEGEQAELAQRRSRLAGDLDPQLVALYDRVASTGGGVAAARLTGTRCGGCRVEFSAVDLAAIRAAKPEEIVQCEECRCILVRQD